MSKAAAYFEGWYLKHQAEGRTLALIPGRSGEGAFVQVVTHDRMWNVAYPLSAYRAERGLRIGGSVFTRTGVRLDIHGDGIDLTGELRYRGLTPIDGDIMGPFRFLPMECDHSVVSMTHRLRGRVILNGDTWDFTGGRGYIEGDRGRSFPAHYTWTQCNAFSDGTSVMASVAAIPFAGFRFTGCIAVVWYRGREYRLATYRGVRVLRRERELLDLRQGGLRLRIEVPRHEGLELPAPSRGVMSRRIREATDCRARYVFSDGGRIRFDETSDHASYEYVE